MTFSYSAMNPNGLVCPAMEPSYSHSSEDSMQSFGYPDLLATSPAQDLDMSSGQTTFDPNFFDFSPPSQYPFPEVYSVPNTSCAIPIPGSQPQYYGPSVSFLSTSISSSSSSPSLSPSSSPLRWTPGDESFALGLSPGVRGSPPETSSK
ncbi:hypothetical protein LTS12_027726 [Elasticomyces elasticus]|nr:hypothetical protein LTS12_027726 [Elasticomyces elasticus]